MSTETTNKKIKIDNGTTFGRTYTDKAVDELLKKTSNKIWYELDTISGTITQNQYNEIKALIDNDSLAGITAKNTLNGYFLLNNLLNNSLSGTFTFDIHSLSSETTGRNIKYIIIDDEITIKSDLSVSYISKKKFIPLLTQNLSNQSIISIKTNGYQENLSIGDGLAIENGVLKTTIPPLPADASTKTYTLKAVNGVLTWVEG